MLLLFYYAVSFVVEVVKVQEKSQGSRWVHSGMITITSFVLTMRCKTQYPEVLLPLLEWELHYAIR